MAALGTAAQSPSAHTCSMPFDAQVLVDQHAAALVDRQAELAHERVRLHAGRPHEARRLDARAVGERGALLVERLQPGAEADLDAALGEVARRVVAEPLRRLGEHAVAAVDQQPALRDVAQPRVVAERLAHEVVRLGQRLDAGVAGADEGEGQPPLGVLEVGVGQLELVQDVVAQGDRVGQVLELQRVLAQSGHVGHS